MKKYRRIVSVLLLVLMMAALLTGCASKEEKDNVITVNASLKARKDKLMMFIRHYRDSYLEENFEQTRESFREDTPQSFPETEVKHQLDREECGGFDVYTLSNGEYENIVLYIHGGAWVMGIGKNHVSFCDELAERLHAKVYMPLYPLAPKYSYEDTYKMVLELYDELLEQGKPIIVMGDSAGGTITLGLTDRIKQSGGKMPEKLVLFSPCIDLSLSDPQIAAQEKKDPVLAPYGCTEFAKMWAKDTDLKDPAVSPAFCDMGGYPETLLFAATEDIFYPDALALFEKLEKAGDTVTLAKGRGLWHIFPLYDIPERETSLALITDFCMN